MSNREIKFILEKTINSFKKDWARTVFRTPLGMSPFILVYGKACHLPLELEHKSYWQIR